MAYPGFEPSSPPCERFKLIFDTMDTLPSIAAELFHEQGAEQSSLNQTLNKIDSFLDIGI